MLPHAWLAVTRLLAPVLLAALTQSPPPAPPAQPDVVTLSIVGTNDLHGAVLPRDGRGGLSLFAGYVANLRKARAADGGAVLVLDAGDMFQGTLESNLNEGAAIVRAYNAIGYDAVAIGNHEFDYGPVGEAATAGPGQDPLGALKARAAESRFPFLTANILDRATGKPLAFPNIAPQAVVEKAGIKVGIIGVATEGSLTLTMPENVRGLAMAPLAETVAREAASVRQAGAKVVVLAAHAGGSCSQLGNPRDTSSCGVDGEVMRLARSLPRGTVDVIVAGHVHLAMAHLVEGIPIVESYSSGRSFGRVDLGLIRPSGEIVKVAIQPLQDIVAGSYEGAPVAVDAQVEALLAPDVERARARKHERLGPVLGEGFTRDRTREGPLGNLVTDWMRAARPGADVAIVNAGGLRADLPPGELTYGGLYEVLPFDDHFATVDMTGRDLRRLLAQNLERGGGLLSVSGVRVSGRCRDGALEVKTEPAIGDDQRVVVLMSDFLATGQSLALPTEGVRIETVSMRDEIARVLRGQTGHAELKARDFFDPARPRIEFPGRRPVRCESSGGGAAQFNE